MPSYTRTINPENQTPNFTGFLEKTAPKDIVVASGNGTSYFKAIVAGTIMGKITASSKYRPCGKQVVNGAYGPGVVVPMQSVDGFFVGDTVTIYDVSAGANLVTGRVIQSIDPSASPPTITINGANVTVEAGDYMFVQDGSGTARGCIDEQGALTFVGTDADGDPRYEDVGAALVFRGVIDEDKLDAVTNLNAYLKADLIDQLNGCDITFL
jgi:hypothetical protein